LSRDRISSLDAKGYSAEQIAVYIKAFDYFWENRMTLTDYSKDLMDVPGIDLDALLHDYHYGVCNAGVNLK
jgi:hypothetical protein